MPTSSHEVKNSQPGYDRRLIVQVFDYWDSLRGSWKYPRMADLDVTAVPTMAEHTFLINLNKTNIHASHIRYIGSALSEDCKKDLVGKPVSAVPRGSLMSRLSDHFLQILANRAPMSFEAEYGHAQGMETKYRGIMLPVSDNGTEIDYILGVINCRTQKLPATKLPPRPLAAVNGSTESGNDTVPKPSLEEIATQQVDIPPPPDHATRPVPPAVAANDSSLPRAALDGAELFERLRECRGAAYILQDAQERTIKTTHRALKSAFQLLREAEERPAAFADLLAENGFDADMEDKVMAVLQLMFGRDYDPEALQDYATALKRALRENQTTETLITFLEGFEDGLKGLVRDEPIQIGQILH